MSVILFPENVRLKPIALPTEHGGWGFILEPLLLGLAVAPSWTGLMVAIGAVSGFLFRQPIRIVWKDFSSAQNTARTHAALVFGGIYFVAASTLLASAITDNGAIAYPLVLALPLGLAVLFLDSRKQSRSIIAEILAPVALGSTGAAVVIAGGWSLSMAAVIWLLLICRAVPTIFYVRSRLRIEYGEPAQTPLAIGSHVAALVAAVALGLADLVPHVVSTVYLALLARAALGLSRLRRPLPARTIGFLEIAWGIFSIVLLAFFLRL